MDDVFESEMKAIAHEVAQKILKKEECGVVEIGNSLSVVSRSEPINTWDYKPVHRFKEGGKVFFIVKKKE